jgi:hypothetical protein
LDFLPEVAVVFFVEEAFVDGFEGLVEVAGEAFLEVFLGLLEEGGVGLGDFAVFVGGGVVAEVFVFFYLVF